jgi:aminomethyltransferase
MGQLEVSGTGAREALARVLTNDIDAVGPGQGQYTLMCEDDGGVIDDLIAYALPDRFLLVVNASNVAACRERLADRLPAGVALADRSLEVAMLALQGPAWRAALEPHLATPMALSLDYFEIGEDVVAGVPCLIARTGYTGEPGVELMCPWDGAPALWDALMSGPAPPEPTGLVARDTLRLEMGYPLYGLALPRRRGDAPPGGGGDARAAGDLPPHRARHPAARPGRAGRRPPGRDRHQRHPVAHARRGDRDGLRAGGGRGAGPRHRDRRPRQAEGRPHRPPPAGGDLTQGVKETDGSP